MEYGKRPEANIREEPIICQEIFVRFLKEYRNLQESEKDFSETSSVLIDNAHEKL